MSAISRELVNALHNHPNAPPPGGRILLCLSESDVTKRDLKDNLDDFYDGNMKIEEITAEELIEKADKEDTTANCHEQFDGIICSNIFTEQKIVENRRKMADVLGVFLRMLHGEGAVLIIRENLEKFSAKLIADLTKFVDVFATKCQSHTLGFRLYGMGQVQDSIFVHSNFLDVHWSLSKSAEIRLYDDKLATFREFLDKTQYTEDNVASYEWIFGKDFISPGGIEENRRVLRCLRRLRPGQKMLDIGVGIGGGARQAAREFGVQVLGCDLSSNMIQHAFERNQRDKDHRVEYQIADAMVYRYEPNSYDIVFSRDCIQHIQDTKALFRHIYTWLKPGGQLLLTMYGKGHGVLQPKFHEYVRKRQYMLKTLDEYRETAHSAGFTNICTENMTTRLREILEIERSRAIANGDEFVERFGKALYDKLLEGWMDKLQFIDDDNQNWLLLRAEKPVHPHAYLTEAGA